MNKKTPKENKQKKTKNDLSFLFINIIIFICTIVLGTMLYIFIQNNNQKEQEYTTISLNKKQELLEQQKLEDAQIELKHYEEKTQAMEIEYIDEDIEETIDVVTQVKPTKKDYIFQFEQLKDKNKPKVQAQLTNPKSTIIKEIKEIKAEEILSKPIIAKIIKPKIIKPEEKPIKKLPKLVIIIDDVSSTMQVAKITNLPFPVTMAFLPPTSLHPISAKIAKRVDIYMIHLPLQAKSNRFEEENTLYITDTEETIDKRITKLKQQYPKAKYINNHTGSKFTSNPKAMNLLLKVLKKHNLIFVDSRTTAKTVARQFAKKHNVRYLARNIFLDNNKNKLYIQNQLKKAVKIAYRDGISIAIGHPYSITLKTLEQSKHLLKGLDVVLIDKI